MKDIERQISFIVESVERILWQIDHDPLSPTFGCAHLDYWRYKTSDVADARRQEVMLPLSMLYQRTYPNSSWEGNEKLKTTVAALLSFWCRIQYSDGSLDEWYKGERAYAAAAFSTHAVAQTIKIMEDVLPQELLSQAKARLAKTAHWLSRHNDLFKTNHQAVGAAALAWAGDVLNDPSFTRQAKAKLAAIVHVQRQEGWFPEIGHMDLGYTFLTVEFAAMAMDLMNDWTHLKPFRRAFEFACEWVHPDLTIGEEYGSCHNTYLSRIAIVLMSQHSGRAAFLRQRLDDSCPGFKGFKSTLSDDLQLLRWAFQPLLAYDYAKKIIPDNTVPPELIPLANPLAGDCLYQDAGLARLMIRRKPVIIAACAGGLVRLLDENGDDFSDYGYAIISNEGYATNCTYNIEIRLVKEGDAIVLHCPISRVKKFFPSFWARIVLRFACSTAIGSKFTRKAIDVIRRKKGTPITQSSANLKSTSNWSLSRTIQSHAETLSILDQIIFDKPVRSKHISFLQSEKSGYMTIIPITDFLADLPERVRDVRIIKVFELSPAWKLRKISLS
jgi:hypothetical protein